MVECQECFLWWLIPNDWYLLTVVNSDNCQLFTIWKPSLWLHVKPFTRVWDGGFNPNSGGTQWMPVDWWWRMVPADCYLIALDSRVRCKGLQKWIVLIVKCRFSINKRTKKALIVNCWFRIEDCSLMLDSENHQQQSPSSCYHKPSTFHRNYHYS